MTARSENQLVYLLALKAAGSCGGLQRLQLKHTIGRERPNEALTETKSFGFGGRSCVPKNKKNAALLFEVASGEQQRLEQASKNPALWLTFHSGKYKIKFFHTVLSLIILKSVLGVLYK